MSGSVRGLIVTLGLLPRKRCVMGSTRHLIKETLSREEKIIVFSERPDFQKLMQQELKTRGIKSHVFIGSQGDQEQERVSQ